METGDSGAERSFGGELLRLLAENVRDYAIFALDPDGKVSAWNAGAERMFGWGEAEILGRDGAVLFTPEDRAAGVPGQELAAARDSGRAEDERWHLRKDGTRFFASGVAVPIRDGRLRGYGKVCRDITDRVRAEEQVRQSEERYRKLVDQSPLSTQILAPDGRTLRVNRAWEELWGGTLAEHLADYNLRADPQLESLGLKPLVERAFAGEAVELPPVEYTPDRGRFMGQARWVSAVMYPIRGAGGRVEEVVLIHRDITDRRAAEEALRESEERQRKLADNLPNGFIYQVAHGPDGGRRFTYVSAGVEAVCGLTPAQALADPLALYRMVLEEDVPALVRAEEEAHRAGRPFDHRFRVRTPGGQVRWLHCRSAARALPDGGGVWDGLAMDVTDRKTAEEDLARDALILAGVSDAVVVTDLAGVVTYWNEGATRLFGWAAEEMLGRPYADRFPEPVRGWVAREIHSRAEEGTAWSGEFEDHRKDGTRVWIDARVARFDDSSGRPAGILGLSRDITARKRAEEALREADRRKDQFRARLAHELRNPLSPVRNALELLRLKADDPGAVVRVREMMERQVGNLVRLVDDLLDVSRIATGKVRLQARRADLADVARQAAADARPGFAAKGVALRAAESGPVWVHGDSTRLAQVLDNLLANALKFTPPGGEVALALSERPGGRAELSVRDTGAGIEPDMLARLFVPFSQADRTLDRSQGGLGLGLAIVKGLVELHGGEVRAESAGRGRGATFTVALPTAAGSPGETDESDARAGAAERLRVLVVEDSPDAAESLRMLLEEYGHEVEVAFTGQEGVRAAARWRPQVVICDIGLPGMDGFAVAAAIRRLPPAAGATLIALSGYGQDADREKGRESGFDEYLTKPADPAALRDLLRKLR
jgi:PAS domain S-box-containing protein